MGERVKAALRHLAEHPLDGKPLKGHFQKDQVWSCRIFYFLVGSNWLDVHSVGHRKDVYR